MNTATATDLHTATARVRKARAALEALILHARDEGASLRAIAAEAGMSHTEVARIIANR